MRCDEIQEYLIDLLYEEGSSSAVFPEVRNHLQTCSACRQELENLQRTRNYLQEWKEESPPRSIIIAKQESLLKKGSHWKYVRYGAVAAMAFLCFMALANAEFTFTKDGFSFRTSLFRQASGKREYYTKNEVRDLMKRALDDSETRTNEVNYLMLQKMLDTVEQDHWVYSRAVRSNTTRNANRN